MTIHRLLGVRSGSVRFRHGEENLLPFEVVIVDEASMVALPLMAKLAVALRGDTCLILLGDRDQLASVEAGAVLGDICGGGGQTRFSDGFATFAARVANENIPVDPSSGGIPLLADSLVVLEKNYRFGAGSGIGSLSRLINEGDARRALSLLKDEESPGCGWQQLPRPAELKKNLTGQILKWYAPFLAAGTAEEALKLFDRFRILCPLRQGVFGVSGMNALVEEILAEKGLIDRHNRWYRGRPVMITKNDYGLKLFNGDIGIVLPDPEQKGRVRVWFPDPDGGLRHVSPVRLPPHETVYAMTVHKSQGSEFDRVLFTLPDHDSEALGRELIYTGITRAKKEVEIWGDEAVFIAAVSRRIERHSGLSDALWQDGAGAD